MGARSKSRALAIASIPALVSLAVFSWLITSGRWNLFGIWTLDSPNGESTGFGDLAFITGVADCFSTENAGQSINLDTCDPYGRPYTPYGLIPGKFLSLFGLGLQHNTQIGIALMLAWVGLVLWLTYLVTRRWNRSALDLTAVVLAITVFAISPTAMLAVERGTIDIAVAAFAALGLIGLSTNRKAMAWFSSASLFVAVIIKYFAVGVFAPVFAPRRWSLPAILGALVTAVFMIANWDNLQKAQSVALADTLSTTRIMFSSTTGLVTILVSDPLAFNPPPGQLINETLIPFLGVLLFALITCGLIVLIRRLGIGSGPTDIGIPHQSWYLIVGGSFALGIPYFLGTSNDYRLIILILPLAGFLIWLATESSAAIRIMLWVMVVSTVISGLTGAAMIPNEYGFILPKIVIVLGDAALATSLAFGFALFINAWLPSRSTKAVQSLGTA